MATIKQRFDKLGLAQSNPVLMEVGRMVAIRLHNNRLPNNGKIFQMEDGKIYWVNDYPEYLVPSIDKMILMIINNQK